jgi:hypothetical protein
MEFTVQHRSNVTLQPTQIRIVILAMFSGLLIYTTVAYVMSRNGSAPAADQAPIFAAVLAILGVSFVVAATVAGRVQTAVIAALGAEPEKADRRRRNARLVVTLVKAALAEAFGLVGTTFMLVTGERYFLAASLIAVFCLIRLLPERAAAANFEPGIGAGESSHNRAIEP